MSPPRLSRRRRTMEAGGAAFPSSNSMKFQRWRPGGGSNGDGNGNGDLRSNSLSTATATASDQRQRLRCADRQQQQQQQHQQQQQARRQRQNHARRQRQRRCVCLPDNYAPPQFPIVWSELRSSRQLCDGSIRCAEERVFPVHRAILSAVSPYFRALFTSSLNPGGRAEAVHELTIPEAPADVLALILDYAYTGGCRVSADNVERLLPLADRLGVLGVVQLCCKFLLSELRPDNCLGIYKFARHYFCRDLEERGRKYIRQYFKEILQEGVEFKELSFEELELILRDDELNARSEELVFEAIKAWVEQRPGERTADLPKLLGCARYGLMRPQYFYENVLTWNLAQSQECKDVLLPVTAYLQGRAAKQPLLPCRQTKLDDELARPRVPYEILFAVGGWNTGSPTNFVETYDTRADRWFLSSYTDVTPRAYHGVCTLNKLIYVIGGLDGMQYFNSVRCFDPATKEWRERACMYHARCYVSVCTHGGKIYALGGKNRLTRMSSCERYDPEANQWELIAPMNWPRSDASAAALGGRIYVVGGFDGQLVLDTTEVYDVETGQWSYIAHLCEPRTGVSLVAFRGCLYAIGGFNGYVRLSSAEKYNPNQQDEWQELAELMLYPRSNFATAILDDMIFVIGGFNGTLPVPYVECYDADNNEWFDAAPMNLNRSALSACVVSGLTNVREYSYHRQRPRPWTKQSRGDGPSIIG